MPVSFHGSALDVAGMADGDGHLFVFDQVFELDFLDAVDDLCASIVSVSFEDFAQLGDDDGLQLLFAREDFRELGDALADLGEFLKDLIDGELREAVELQLEDGVDLDVTEAEPFARACRGDGVLLGVELDAANRGFLAADQDANRLVFEEFVQVLPGIRAAGRSADDFDHVIDVVERDAVAEQDVLALAGLAQLVLRAPADHVDAVFEEQVKQLQQAKLARLAGDDGEQDHAKRFLHLRHLEKLVEDDFRLFVALHFDDDAHTVAIAFIADVRYALNLLVLDQLGNVADQPRLVHLIRQFGDNDVLAVLAALFDGGFRADLEAAAAGLVGLLDSFAAVDIAAGGKIGARNDLHHLLERGFRVFDQQDRGFDCFLQVVRRDVRRHADRDAGGAVDEQVRNPRGKNDRLFFAFVKIGNEIDSFLLDVREHFLGDLRKARFGVPHRSRRIAVDRAEVALAVDEGIAHVEILRQADEGVVNGRVAVRMEFAEDFADDLGALAVGLSRGESELVHAEENAPVDGLEAVAHVGQGAPDDYAHGVIEVRLLHFRFDIDRRHYRLILFVRHFSPFVNSEW